MTAVSNSIVISKTSALCLSSGSSLKSVDHHATIMGPNNSSFSLKGSRKSSAPKRKLTLQASYSDRPSSGSIFVGGFVLGGLIIGTLSCVYAPQISKALAGATADKKDLMRKLPKFIYDEEKALERQRKKLAEKIEQLNSAIDNVSNQLRSDEPPNGAAVNVDDMEALI
ncbi:Localized to the inner membrane of the chloroplast [Olea europaea subsp. europaea]|uniref:Localized to the inner membrane of the chloroplast n=2 Tax=Olea europaea subsp. europaea TaxID=158383 RepID=A0A8S0Q5J1_OLEEU|nr:Localized to the inner membrane of the chloroplast [Olea europaea subsp. europaea]